MKNSEKFQEIQDILVKIYGETLASSQREELVDEIYDCAFIDGYDLADIVITLTEVETGNDEKAMNVFHTVVDLMDDGALTAKKLYHCFLENFEDLEVLCKLLNRNAEWLSLDEKKRIKEAAECFDNEILELCIGSWKDKE